MRQQPGRAELAAFRLEEGHDPRPVGTDLPAHGRDLAHPSATAAFELRVHDDVDRARDGRHDERRIDVAAGQQRQRAELAQRLRGAVGVQGAHPGYARVQRDQQIQRLRLAHLPDHEPVGPHAQRLLDETPQADLTRSLQARLAALHRHVVDRVGMEEFNAVFAGPENLPGKAEIADPDAWVARVLG